MSDNHSNKYRALAKDTGLFTISSFGSKILVFLLTPLYTSVLTTNDYGIADLITTTITFIYPVLTLAIADAALRYALDKSNNKNEVFSVSTVFTVLSVFILLLLKPAVILIDNSLSEYWEIFVLNYALFNIHNYFSNFVKGLQKTKLFALQGIIHTLTIIVCNILFLVVLKMKLEGYLLSIVIGYIVPILIMFFGAQLYSYLVPFRINKYLLVDMLKYSIPMVPTILAWAINTSIDKYMIIWMYGLGDSGVYSVAHKIPTIITTILTVFIQAWQISVISNHGSEDESHYYTVVYKGLDFVTVCGCLFVIILSKPLAALLFAKDFFAAWQYVPMLIISAMFSSHAGFLAAAYRASKKTTSLFVSVIVGSALNIFLNYVLLTRIGVLGAAIATAISFFGVWFVRIVFIQRIVKVEVKILHTVVTYSALFFSAILITLDVQYAQLMSLVLLLLILTVNKDTISYFYKVIRQYLTKRKGQ